MGGLGGSPLAGLLAVGDGLFQGEYLAKPLKAKYAFPQYRRSWVFMEIIFHALSEAPSTLPRGMNKSPRLYCMAWLNTNMLLERTSRKSLQLSVVLLIAKGQIWHTSGLTAPVITQVNESLSRAWAKGC